MGQRSANLVCLLPARNCEHDVPGFLESAGRFADAIVVLDDGSTDNTRPMLAASPLVRVVLSNPRRERYTGWNDRANRQLLLEGAAELEPGWIVFLDADERIDPEDAVALREFVAGDALRGCAYGLQLFRCWGEELCVARPTTVYRLFAYERGQQLPQRRLHFNPVPRSTPRAAWVPTTIRIRHLDSPQRLANRRDKYAEADPRGRWDRDPPRLLSTPHERLDRWRPRAPSLHVLAPGRGRETGAEDDGQAGRPVTLAALLPARNCEHDLAGYFDSVAPLVDGIVALDDGSTDRTAEILAASPLVTRLLREPRRQTYAGWDDRVNRERLLAAAVELGFDWVLFLDADERIDPDDAAALRDFVERDADPLSAYGFRVFRMIEDARHYDLAELWVYRLFSAKAGGRLPPGRLHLVPVPDSIPRARWRRTTIRIKHLASLTVDRREARLAKYEQADPDLRWQRSYRGMLLEPMEPKPWPARPSGLPALADPLNRGRAAEIDLELLAPGAPVLSAIVISRNDEATIERTVRSVVEQDCPQPFETIVVVSGTDRTAEVVRRAFPEVRLVELAGPAWPGRARNAGLAVARGEYVSFPGSHVELPQGSLAARLRAHERGYAMVTGTILNGTPTRAGWASFFLDHSGALPGRPSAELDGAPAHCSYVREFLLGVGGFPEDIRAGEDTVVNGELWRRGHRAYREREVRLVHKSRCRTPARLIRHHFQRGRAYGRILLRGHRGDRPALRRSVAAAMIGYPRRRLADTDARVRRWGGPLRSEYRHARPLVLVGVLAAWAGVWREVLGASRRPGESDGEGPSPPARRGYRRRKALVRA